MQASDSANPAGAQRRMRRSGLGTGTTSLLMIFTLLCLATLALLSLSTAVSDARIKTRGMEATRDLAAAQGQASEALAELDAVLAGRQTGYTGSENAYYDAVQDALAQDARFSVGAEDNLVVVSVDVNESNVLVTQVRILPPGEGARYAVVAQQQVNTAEWTPEGGAVWQGG